MENKTIMALCVGAILMTTACDKGGSGSADATATTAPKAQKEYWENPKMDPENPEMDRANEKKYWEHPKWVPKKPKMLWEKTKMGPYNPQKY